jgi:hypothetical protein
MMTTIDYLPDQRAGINPAAVRQIMHDWPELTEFGFGPCRRADFERDRAAMLTPANLDEFDRARRWLQCFPKVKAFNQTGTSYGLKHLAEPIIGYTTNGMFIAAAVAEGFKVKPAGASSPNALMNISRLAWYPS